MTRELAKGYEPHDVEMRWYAEWEGKGYFHAAATSDRKPYSIVIPPPNVTGALHMGHALNNTLQDVLIRWRRMQGYNALWMPRQPYRRPGSLRRTSSDGGTGRPSLPSRRPTTRKLPEFLTM